MPGYWQGRSACGASGHEATPRRGGERGVAVRSGPGGVEPVPSSRKPTWSEPKLLPSHVQSYQSVIERQPSGSSLPLCCQIVGASTERANCPNAAFFDLDKTI